LPFTLIAAAALASAGAQASPQLYRLQVLEPVPGDVAPYANDINNRGQVVGGCSSSTVVTRACLWRNGALDTDLSFDVIQARPVNSGGQVTGDLVVDAWMATTHACMPTSTRKADA
jgi:probable HAF family extracellular repeat protein